MPVPGSQRSRWRTEITVFRRVRHGRRPENHGGPGFDEIARFRSRMSSSHTRESVLRNCLRTRMFITSFACFSASCTFGDSRVRPGPCGTNAAVPGRKAAILWYRFAYAVPGRTPANDGTGLSPSVRTTIPASLRTSTRREFRRAGQGGDFLWETVRSSNAPPGKAIKKVLVDCPCAIS